MKEQLPQQIHLHELSARGTSNVRLKRMACLSLVILCLLMLLKLLLECVSFPLNIHYITIAFFSVLPFMFTKKPWRLLYAIDWGTLIFFVAMFVFMRAVWNTQILQQLLMASGLSIRHTLSVFSISVFGSQLLSNVPLVALYLPLLKGAEVSTLMALAAGATIAGNFLLLGAASNIIVLSNAEKRAGEGFSPLQFMRVGIPLGLMNLLVYYGYFECLRWI